MRLIGNRRKEHDQFSQAEPIAVPRVIQHKAQVQKPLQRNFGSGTMNGQTRETAVRAGLKPQTP
jgi:hypothetical protein